MKEDQFLRYTDEPIDEIGEKAEEKVHDVRCPQRDAMHFKDAPCTCSGPMSVEDRLTVIEGMLGYLVVAVEQLSQFTTTFSNALKGAANNPMIKMMMPPEIVDSLKDM